MPDISLTDFVDFVIKSGTPKMTKVRELRSRDEYEPAKDFWRTLRLGIVEMHASGLPKAHLDGVLNNLTDPRKVSAYPSRVAGYKTFLGRKTLSWFTPARDVWISGDLKVRINPELGLNINGADYLMKLYFKEEKLDQRRVDTALYLMDHVLRPKVSANVVLGIVDVSEGRMFPSKGLTTNFLPLLRGEAQSFVTIWNSL